MHRTSISIDSKKNATLKSTNVSTPKNDIMRRSECFSATQDKQLNKLRKFFNVRPQTSGPAHMHSEVQKSQRMPSSKQSPERTIEVYSLPEWLRKRQDFRILSQDKYFDFSQKVVSICEIDQFKRSEQQKNVVASYLEKLFFFRLMPYDMLMSIAGRLTTQQYDDKEIVCKKGEMGDCLYVIFSGSLSVVEKNLKFEAGAILGRNALDNACPRSATLMSLGTTVLLMLKQQDYTNILTSVMKVENSKQEKFLKSLPIFTHFSDEKIKKFCANMQGRFLTPYDTLYTSGDLVDNLYIVKNGTLVKQVVMDLEDSNRWPCKQKQWISRTTTKTINMEMTFNTGALLGYYDIIDSEFDADRKRVETIDAKTDCFLLFITKTKFFNIFTSADIQFFLNYHVQNNPMSFEQLVTSTRGKLDTEKKKFRSFEQAISSHLTQFAFNYETLKKKNEKYKPVILSSRRKLLQFQNQYRVIRAETNQKYLTSQYE